MNKLKTRLLKFGKPFLTNLTQHIKKLTIQIRHYICLKKTIVILNQNLSIPFWIELETWKSFLNNLSLLNVTCLKSYNYVWMPSIVFKHIFTLIKVLKENRFWRNLNYIQKVNIFVFLNY